MHVSELSGLWWAAAAGVTFLVAAVIVSIVGEKENRRALREADRQHREARRMAANYDRLQRERRLRELIPTTEQVNAVIEVYERMNS